MGEVCDGESRGWEKCAVASAGEGAVRDGGGSEGGTSNGESESRGWERCAMVRLW